MKHILREARSLGPYVAMALLLPGGSVIALLAWLYRHYRQPRSIKVI